MLDGSGSAPRGLGQLALTVLAAVLAIAGVAVAASGPASQGHSRGSSRHIAEAAQEPSPSITIQSPAPDGATYAPGHYVPARFSCAANPGTVTECHVQGHSRKFNGPVDTTSLGMHGFTVFARDSFGNIAHKTYQYTVAGPPSSDTTEPDISIHMPEERTYAQGQVVNADYSCSDDSGTVAYCHPRGHSDRFRGHAVDTGSQGYKSFTVVTSDYASNFRAAHVNYQVGPPDTSKPTITLTAPVNGAHYHRGDVISAAYSCSDPDGNDDVAACRGHQGAADVASGSPIDTSTTGAKTFTVDATDKGGANTQSKTVTYTVDAPRDTTKPSASVTAPLARFQRQHPITVAWAGKDAGSGVASFDVRVRRAALGSGHFGAYHSVRQATHAHSVRVAGVPGATSCFSVRARDKAGNVSPYSAERCTATPLDDHQLRRSSHWVPIGQAGYYGGSVLRSDTPGSTLGTPAVSGEQLALLVTTRRDGGTIEVRWQGRSATIGLRSGTTQRRHLVKLPRFSGVGHLRVRVAGGGGVVEVDGLAAWKRP
jgi:hypothetical protein